MSDLELTPEKKPEEDEVLENVSQEPGGGQSELEVAADSVVEAAEQPEVMVGEVVDTASQASEDAGEGVQKASDEIEMLWEPEAVDFSTVAPEPVAEPPAGVIPPAVPAWKPEPPPQRVPPPVPPAPPVRPVAEALSADDERTWALLAHLSVLLNLVTGFLGPVAAIVIYFAFKDRSRYVRYHAMQAFLFQLLWWVGGGILATVLWITVGVLAIVIVGLCLIPFALAASLLPLGALVYGVIGGIQVSQGQDFRYWLVGDWVRSELTGD